MTDEPTAQSTDPTIPMQTRASAVRSSPHRGAMPETVGGYRIERPLGTGGMGDVYVGFDERLRRHVAIKAITAERRLEPEARERFLREARVLSSLEHPGICAIHDYLQSADGDFLVLELIDGRDLDLALQGATKTESLRIAEDLTRVLTAAHAAGIVHRDLKPGNVMITTTGAVKVLDFGIARPSGAAPETGTDEPGTDATRSLFLTRRDHAIVGTPMYMSPEQARGESVSPASDMYALGLMLQQMLTDRPPYDDGLSVMAYVERAAAGRSHAARGDRDLVRLIERLKSFEPAARPTALEAADRLRWIRDRGRRRTRRLAVAAAIVLVILAGLKYTLDLRTERDAATFARNDAIASRNEVEDQMTFMLRDLGPHFEAIGRTEVIDAVARRYLDYFARVPEQHLGDDDLWRRARALHLLGTTQMNRGSLDAAEEAFLESVQLAASVTDRHPEQPQWLADLGAGHFYVGYLQMERGEFDGALEQFRLYQDIADRLVHLDGPKPKWLLEQAYAHNNVGAVLQRQGALDAASAEIRAALAIKTRLVEADPNDTEAARSLANSHSWLASVREEACDRDEALAARLEEQRILEGLVESDPHSATDRLRLSRCHNNVGELLLHRGDADGALAHFALGAPLIGALVEHDPTNLGWQAEVATNHRLAAEAHRKHGAFEAALDRLAAGLPLLATLVADEPDQAEWRLQLVATRIEIVRVALDQRRWTDALDEADRIIADLAPLIDDENIVPMARLRLGQVNLDRGTALLQLARRADAGEAWVAALRAIEPVAEDGQFVTAHRVLAFALLRLGRCDEARSVIDTLRHTCAWSEGLEQLAIETGCLSTPDEG